MNRRNVMGKIVESPRVRGSGDPDFRRRHDRAHRVRNFLEVDEIFTAIEQSFFSTRRSRDLIIVRFLGDGRDSGLCRGHWSLEPRMQKKTI